MTANTFEMAPEQSHRLLRKFIPKRLQPFLRGMRKRWQQRQLTLEEPFKTAFPYTQVSPVRRQNLLRLAREIETRGVEGAIVECGVLDGGTAAIMAYGTAASGRPIHLFDSWDGLPPSTAEDGQDGEKWTGECVGSPSRVLAVMRKLGIDSRRLNLHKGWFDDTFAKAKIEKIALLHVDADFYKSVRLSLETWMPKLALGGYAQFDDYASYIGCRTAVDEYLKDHTDFKFSQFGAAGDKAYFVERVPR